MVRVIWEQQLFSHKIKVCQWLSNLSMCKNHQESLLKTQISRLLSQQNLSPRSQVRLTDLSAFV